MNESLVFYLRSGWRLQWEPAQQRHVLLYPEGMVQLNDSAGAILELVDGQRNVADLIEELQQRYPEAPSLGQDVREFLVDAEQQGWIRHE